MTVSDWPVCLLQVLMLASLYVPFRMANSISCIFFRLSSPSAWNTDTTFRHACAVRTCRTDTHSSLSSHRISFSLKVSDVLKSIKNCKIHLKRIWNQPLQKDSCCIKQSVKYPNISKWSQKIVRLLCNLGSLHTVTYSICTGYDPTWSWRVD